MKLPKKILVCGKEFDIIENKNKDGGGFRESTHRIEIGTRLKQYTPEIFAHEVIESIFAIRDMRYTVQHEFPENGDFLFSFNHKELEMAIKDIVLAFKGVKF